MTQIQSCMASSERVFNFLDEEEVEDESNKNKVIANPRGEVEFKHVTFAYADEPTKTIIKDFSCFVKPGQKVAIVGPTGAGKSTILDALCLALYDKTPRFSASVESLYMSDIGESRVNQADVKNILRRGTGEGFAEVDFLGASGHCYRSRWSVRRTGSRANGALRSQTIK